MLNALLKGLPLTATEKLNLTVVWDREDLAREILEDAGGDEAEWPNGSLDVAMMNALMYDRVGFVNLLLASGIVMERFLTISRLEQLYNSVNHAVASKSLTTRFRYFFRKAVRRTRCALRFHAWRRSQTCDASISYQRLAGSSKNLWDMGFVLRIAEKNS